MKSIMVIFVTAIMFLGLTPVISAQVGAAYGGSSTYSNPENEGKIETITLEKLLQSTSPSTIQNKSKSIKSKTEKIKSKNKIEKVAPDHLTKNSDNENQVLFYREER